MARYFGICAIGKWVAFFVVVCYNEEKSMERDDRKAWDFRSERYQLELRKSGAGIIRFSLINFRILL